MDAGADGRSLLSRAVSAGGGRGADLARLLVNFGAKVWPDKDVEALEEEEEEEEEEEYVRKPKRKKEENKVVCGLNKEREQSAFTWFLRHLIQEQNKNNADPEVLLERYSEVTALLGNAMGQEDPARMRAHVARAMMQEGRCARAEGPLFRALKARLAPHWRRPQALKFLCLREVRAGLGRAGRADLLAETGGAAGAQLAVPSVVMQYLQFA